jgi:polyisoprenoid-binding protein YceI
VARGGRLFRALAAIGLAASAAQAQTRTDERVELDALRSHVEFRVKVMWLVGVRGQFGAVHGVVDVDRFRSQAVVDARIDTDSVRMNVRGYEDWVKSPEFFDVAAHPQIRFVSEPFPLQRLHKGGDLPGTLTLRGVSQPIRLVLQAAACERPGYDCPIVATGAISRSPFGMRSRLGTLSDRVELRFDVFAKASVAASSAPR